MGMCPAPVLTWPEAPGSETLWLTCQGVAGSPALYLGVTGHRWTPLTLGDPGAVNPDTLYSFQRTAYPHLVFHCRSHTRTHTHTHTHTHHVISWY